MPFSRTPGERPPKIAYNARYETLKRVNSRIALLCVAALRFASRDMALIRVTNCKVEDSTSQDLILNTAHIVMVSPDQQKRGSWVQLVTGEPVLVCLTFDEMWTLIQRET